MSKHFGVFRNKMMTMMIYYYDHGVRKISTTTMIATTKKTKLFRRNNRQLLVVERCMGSRRSNMSMSMSNNNNNNYNNNNNNMSSNSIMRSSCCSSRSFLTNRRWSSSHSSSSRSSSSSIPATGNNRRRTISSISFSGAGFVATYHFGVAQCLIEHGYIIGSCGGGNSHSSSSSSSSSSTSSSSSSTSSDKQQQEQKPPILVGVSSGALVAAALGAGVQPRDGLDAILYVADSSKAAGSRFTPGHSLVDIIEEAIGSLILNTLTGTGTDDEETFLQRIEYGRLLRIGLTDRRIFPPTLNSKASVYVDQYRGIHDILAACLVSCYIPGVTGPIRGSLDQQNHSIRMASHRLNQLLQLGYIKDSTTNQPLLHLQRGLNTNTTTTTHDDSNDNNNNNNKNHKNNNIITNDNYGNNTIGNCTSQTNNSHAPSLVNGHSSSSFSTTTTTAAAATTTATKREIFWDGAMNNLCPIVDENTVVVTPVITTCQNPKISPISSNTYSSKIAQYLPKIPCGSGVLVHLTMDNFWLVRGMDLDHSKLEDWYHLGYNDTQRFLKERNV